MSSILPSGLLDKVKTLFKSPIILFVYGIMSKWFIAIFVTALIVTYWVFKGLSDAGIIQAAENVVFRAFTDTKSVAQFCVPKILHFSDFWECLQNPPEYVPSEEEKTLEHTVKTILDPSGYDEKQDPYAN
jgi:hypothetical protein